jgi:tRNA pseudouridine13 synthase
LWGNRFSVALRFIDKSISNESISKNVKNIEKLGFINYFGMQRFGSYSVRTHQIGKEILNHNW